MLEDLMKICEVIALERDKSMVNWWRHENFKIHVLIKFVVCVESEFHMKNTKLEDWCSLYRPFRII